uniref:UPAR/Ly6 domain-containing protein n=1 Tax=Pyxicephalus adspersus TaxID=30357 RepID=A0AAV2ZKP5_PYXAD|nr:TPA: hypothetical protein GDO54_003321 [Pyxicephalus adspersus]
MVVKKCASYETTCISMAYRTQDGSNTVMKGCATTDLCNQTSIIDTGSRSIYMTASCCESDFCNVNRFSTAQVYSNRLQCNACNSSSSSCTNSQPIFCDQVNNNCVDVVTMEVNGNTKSSSSYIKGCGSGNIGDSCTNLFAYSTGTYQRYTYLSCCNNNNRCNSDTKTVPVLNNNNGITCYGCKDNGNNECATKNQTLVSCKGTLLRCMEAFDQNRRTIMKGCSTVAFCSSTNVLQQSSNVSEIMCCAGSLCNNFTRETASEVINPSSIANRNTDFSILVIFICLMTAIMRH